MWNDLPDDVKYRAWDFPRVASSFCKGLSSDKMDLHEYMQYIVTYFTFLVLIISTNKNFVIESSNTWREFIRSFKELKKLKKSNFL